MLIVISPAKTLDFDTLPTTNTFSQPTMLDDSEKLIDVLTTKSPSDIEKLMKISPKLAELNAERYHTWSRPFDANNAKQAVLAFKGDVYTGLDAESLSDKELAYAQDHLRILSGLYGLLRPLDLMQAYRLEMGTKLDNPKGKNLYEFWGNKITDAINAQLADQQMSAWVIKNQVEELAQLSGFNVDGYQYSSNDSDALNPVFLRKQG